MPAWPEEALKKFNCSLTRTYQCLYSSSSTGHALSTDALKGQLFDDVMPAACSQLLSGAVFLQRSQYLSLRLQVC